MSEDGMPRMLYYIVSLHQTTTAEGNSPIVRGCIISFLYIKPQPGIDINVRQLVVLYRFSTSNHNKIQIWLLFILLYYIVSLHQTTTLLVLLILLICCIISFLYIKPQLQRIIDNERYGCIISFLYIKPQPHGLFIRMI